MRRPGGYRKGCLELAADLYSLLVCFFFCLFVSSKPI